MDAVLYRLDNRRIHGIVKDVAQVKENGDVINNAGEGMFGNDMTILGICVIDSAEGMEIGDTFPELSDKSYALAPTQEQRVEALEAALLAMMGL